MARTAKKKIAIYDEGVLLVEDVDSIDFAGADVSGSAIGAAVTETFTPAGASGYTKETPTGTVDGSNTSFTVTVAPVYVVADGTTYFEGAGYSLAGLTITMDNPPSQYIRSFY